jgi:hypothetical protein
MDKKVNDANLPNVTVSGIGKTPTAVSHSPRFFVSMCFLHFCADHRTQVCIMEAHLSRNVANDVMNPCFLKIKKNSGMDVWVALPLNKAHSLTSRPVLKI